jgi:hypothetical protein
VFCLRFVSKSDKSNQEVIIMRGQLMFAVFFFTVLLGVNIVHARQPGNTLWITGKVMSIEQGQNESLVSLYLAGGESFNVAAANNLLGDIKIGDIVTVQIVKGWAEMVEIAKGGAIPTPGPEKKDVGPQWVAGQVVAIEQGRSEGLLSVKQWNGNVFNIAIANDKMEGVKVGNYVTVKIVKGWAQSVTKKQK